MVQSSDGSQRGFSVRLRRVVTLVLVGLVLLGGVAGVLVGGTGIAAAQQSGGGKDKTITRKEFHNWVQKIVHSSESRAKKLVKNNPKKKQILKREAYQILPMGYPQGVQFMLNNKPKELLEDIFSETEIIKVPQLPVDDGGDGGGSGGGDGGGSGGGDGGGSGGGDGSGGEETENPVDAIIKEFKKQKLGWAALSPEERDRVRQILEKMAHNNLSQSQINDQFADLSQIFTGLPTDNQVQREKKTKKREDIITKYLGVSPDYPDPIPDINIPSLLDIKLDALADSFMDAVKDLLKEVYTLIFDTPVPVNSGWHQILGEPTNDPFKTLYTALMQEKLYPVMQKLLGLVLIFLAGAVAIPQFRHRHRIVDLLINLVAGITLLFFAWPVVTFMHGVTDQITMFILPNASKVGSSVKNLVSMAGAPIAMYLFGSSGLFATLFVLGLEVGFRRVLLAYLLPYLFGPVMLIRFVSPWSRLRRYASMFLWQYVNVLAMVIPMAIIMRAIIALKWNFSVSGFATVLVIIALFMCMIAIPVVSTWFFLQVPDMVNERVQSVASGARNRAPSVRDAFGGARTAADMTATGGRAVRDRAKEMVTASSATQSSSSSEADDTTAAEIRNFYHEQNSGPMSAESVKNVYINHYTGNDQQVATDGGTERPPSEEV